ncbi:hypothetical protein Tco_0874466 [Tanacetum coccineum]|uniref:Uncharacterized protein n=1 Tax=Tanacetum coccineum TaxID=301880 RepID=A0ABQ5BLP5_9ASTR
MNLVTTLSDWIRALEADYKKIGKQGRQARVCLSDTEVVEDDSSKLGGKVTPTKVIQDQEGSEKASDEVSTTKAKKSTASEEVQDPISLYSNYDKPRQVAPASMSLWMQNMEVKSNQSQYKCKGLLQRGSREEEIDTQEELKEDVKEPGVKRKKFIPRKTKDEDKSRRRC